MCGIKLHLYATGSLMALFRLDMLILKRMQLASPAGVPATISFQTARLSSAGLLRCLDSIPSMRSCRTQSVREAKKARKERKGKERKGKERKGKERKEKLTLFSDHNGSLQRQQPGSQESNAIRGQLYLGEEFLLLVCSLPQF